jgi:hypothetical protein
MNVSTRKTVRTSYQAVTGIAVALAVAIPVFQVNFPKYAAYGGMILAAVAIVTKVQTSLEQSGVIKKILDPALATDAIPVVVEAVPATPDTPYVGAHEATAADVTEGGAP